MEALTVATVAALLGGAFWHYIHVLSNRLADRVFPQPTATNRSN